MNNPLHHLREQNGLPTSHKNISELQCESAVWQAWVEQGIDLTGISLSASEYDGVNKPLQSFSISVMYDGQEFVPKVPFHVQNSDLGQIMLSDIFWIEHDPSLSEYPYRIGINRVSHYKHNMVFGYLFDTNIPLSESGRMAWNMLTSPDVWEINYKVVNNVIWGYRRKRAGYPEFVPISKKHDPTKKVGNPRLFLSD